MRPGAGPHLRWAAGLVALLAVPVLWLLWKGGELSAGSALWGGTAAAVVLSLAGAGRLLGGALLRVGLALLPLVAVAAAAIWGAILPGAVAEEAKPALIAGVVVATGWLATFLASEFQKAREREQTRRDVLLALRSEVVTILEKLDNHPILAAAASVQTKMAAGGDGAGAYHPFAASESPTTVYDAVKDSIVTLRPETLEPALRFYAAFSELDSMVRDSRTEGFKGLPAARRVAFHKALTQQRRHTLSWALRALYQINVALDVPRPEEIARSGLNPDVAQWPEIQ